MNVACGEQFTGQNALVCRFVNSLSEEQRYLHPSEVWGIFGGLAERHADSADIAVKIEPFKPDGQETGVNFFILEPKLRDGEQPLRTAVFQCNPHSNEVLWTRTATALAKYFCENPDDLHELGYRLVFFDAEPGSTDLNSEELFNADADVLTVLKSACRTYTNPDFDHPLSDPELAKQYRRRTWGGKAAAWLIDKFMPEYWQSMHDGECPNDYMFVSRDFPELWPLIVKLHNVVGLPLGESPEGGEKIAPGIYQMKPKEKYSTIEGVQFGENSILHHAHKLGPAVFALLSETPRFEATFRQLSEQEVFEFRVSVREQLLDVTRQMRDIVSHPAVQALQDPMLARILKETIPATTSWTNRVNGWDDLSKMPDDSVQLISLPYWIGRFLGQAARLARGAGLEDKAALADQTLERIAAQVVEATGAKPISIRRRVALQAGCALLAMLELKRQGATART